MKKIIIAEIKLSKEEMKLRKEFPFGCDLCDKRFKTDKGMLWSNPIGICVDCQKK